MFSLHQGIILYTLWQDCCFLQEAYCKETEEECEEYDTLLILKFCIFPSSCKVLKSTLSSLMWLTLQKALTLRATTIVVQAYICFVTFLFSKERQYRGYCPHGRKFNQRSSEFVCYCRYVEDKCRSTKSRFPCALQPDPPLSRKSAADPGTDMRHRSRI
jgi:hypothetical protein